MNKTIHNIRICDRCDSKNWQTTHDVSQLLGIDEACIISHVRWGNSKKVPIPDLKITLGLNIVSGKKKIMSSNSKGFYLWLPNSLVNLHTYDKANMLLNKKLIDEPVIID